MPYISIFSCLVNASSETLRTWDEDFDLGGLSCVEADIARLRVEESSVSWHLYLPVEASVAARLEKIALCDYDT
jgi:hypothetical protein